MQLLVICPTRRRPARCAEMLESFHKTKSKGTEIVVVTAYDDNYVDEYKRVLKGVNHFVTQQPLHLTEVLNIFSYQLNKDVPYFGEVNDDHFYITKHWDKILIDEIEKKGHGWGVACGTDTVDKNWYTHRHPSAAVISGNIVRALGYFVYPKIQHVGTDMYLRDIGDGISRLFHVPEVVIEHRHYLNNKAEKDENYNWVYAEQDNYGKDMYRYWRDNVKPSDIEKIKGGMQCF